MGNKRVYDPDPNIPKERLYIPLEKDGQFKWEWTADEIAKLKQYQKYKVNPFKIGQLLNRDPDEVAICIISLAREGRLRDDERQSNRLTPATAKA